MPSDDIYGFEDDGQARRKDPHTSQDAAGYVSAGKIKFYILTYLELRKDPRNGSEIADGLDRHDSRDTVVPRLAPLRRYGYIKQEGLRPGPSGRSQIAYVITPKGRAKLVEIRANLTLKGIKG